ncbi:MAG: hypothetical protein LUH14_11260 [Clostridiaceae bacterium]|nr:hypothetical protein [Clostridiaceae bacterium]
MGALRLLFEKQILIKNMHWAGKIFNAFVLQTGCFPYRHTADRMLPVPGAVHQNPVKSV